MSATEPKDLASILLWDNSAPSGNEAFFEEESGAWRTYGQLRDDVDRLACVLAARNKELVLLGFDNDAISVSVYLSCLRAGHAVAIVDPKLGSPAGDTLIERYQPQWCFMPAAARAWPALRGTYEQTDLGPSSMTAWRRTGSSGPAIHPSLSVLLSTSGSTGSPKFVRLSATNVASNTDDIVRVLDIAQTDRAIASLPFHYSYGLSVLHTHLRAGASISITRRALADPAFWSIVRAQRCTSFAGVPFSYKTLRRMDMAKLDAHSLRKMTQAGGALDPADVRYFHELMHARGGQFFVMYGQTEASPRMTTLRHEEIPRKAGSVGLSMPSGKITIRALDRSDGEVAPSAAGRLGEIEYSGPNVMMGYAQSSDDLARGDDIGGILATGDLGYIDDDGYLYVRGRNKRIAKILGHRINLDEVEAMARSHGTCAVTQMQEQLVLFVAAPQPGDVDRIAASVLDMTRLHRNCVKVVPLASLPMTANGKTDYPRLNAMLSEQPLGG